MAPDNYKSIKGILTHWDDRRGYKYQDDSHIFYRMLWETVVMLTEIISLICLLWKPASQYGTSRTASGIILDMGLANERRRYYVTPSLTGRAQTQNDQSECVHMPGIVNNPNETMIDYTSLETKKMCHSQTREILLSISRNRLIDASVTEIKLTQWNLVKSLFSKRKKQTHQPQPALIFRGMTSHEISTQFWVVVSCVCCGQ